MVSKDDVELRWERVVAHGVQFDAYHEYGLSETEIKSPLLHLLDVEVAIHGAAKDAGYMQRIGDT